MGRSARDPHIRGTAGATVRHDRGPGRGAALLAGLLLLPPAAPAPADPGWQPIGRAQGVEAYSAQTPTGVVRIGFRNTNEHPVGIRIERAVIWCGSEVKGEGRAIETRIEPFTVAPAEFRIDPAWRRTCRQPRYFVEFRGITIERR